MRITMICIGSTGDVRPYMVLGRELKKRGHDVALCAFSDFEQVVLSEGLRFKPVSGDVKNIMANLMTGATGLGFLKQVESALEGCLDPFLSDIEAACDDAQAIIGNYFGQIFRSIAEVRHVPYIQTHFFTIDQNSTAAMSSSPFQGGCKWWNWISYPLGHLVVSAVEKRYLAAWRRERGMPPRRWETAPNYQLNGHTIPTLYAISSHVFPRPKNWPENIHMPGYWLGEAETEFEPSAELKAFLEKGEKPVYIGFGSMVSDEMDKTLETVLEAIRQSGVRAVMASGWSGVKIPESENVFAADFVPHDWLFHQVCAVVHHGGAGTTAAGLRAGLPTLIIPFGGDQPIWAQRVKELRVGPRAIPRNKLSVKRLSKALTELVSNEEYRMNAQRIGEALRAEKGEVNAADIIERELDIWLANP